jgi:hypothetical protein
LTGNGGLTFCPLFWLRAPMPESRKHDVITKLNKTSKLSFFILLS